MRAHQFGKGSQTVKAIVTRKTQWSGIALPS